jgi:hypothetical protein
MTTQVTSIYAYSKDYALLYQLLCAGQIAIAWVDYRIRPQSPGQEPIIQRDICQIVREKEWDIQFFVRGMGYGRVMHTPWQKIQRTEEEQFIFECEALHIEFIVGAAVGGPLSDVVHPTIDRHGID